MQTTIRWLELAGAVLAAVCLPAIMLVISADAILRYAINAPLQWSFDLVAYYLMIAAAYLAVSDTFRHGDHICINLLQSRMPPRLRRILDAAGSLLAMAVFTVVAAGSWVNAINAFQDREYLPGYFNMPLWPSHAPIALGTTVLVLRLAHHVFILLRDGEDPHVSTDWEVAE